MLGTGHSESLRFWNCSALVETSSTRLLIDCGHTIKHALHDAGLTLHDIDAVYISHVHGDHVFGLERLAYETKFGGQRRVKLFLQPSLEVELWDRTLRGSLGTTSEGTHESLSDFFEVVYLESRFRIDDTVFETVPVSHTPGKPTFGLLINGEIFYSSDTNPIPEILEPSQVSSIFHDVTLRDSNPVHSTLSELITRYSPATRQKMYLMGYEDNVEDFLPVINREFAGIATQGQVVTLR